MLSLPEAPIFYPSLSGVFSLSGLVRQASTDPDSSVMARKKRAGTTQSSPAAKDVQHQAEPEEKKAGPRKPDPLEPDPPVDAALISSSGAAAQKCYAAVTEFTRGAR